MFNFRDFLTQEEMDPSPEKTMGTTSPSDNQTMDYFAGGLGDEMGIEWKRLVKALEKDPWVSAHFPLGSPNKEVQYKLAAWEIVPGSLSPNGADIQLKQTPNMRSYLKDKHLNKSSYQDNKRYHLSRKELIQFLTSGWTPAVQAAAGGGMGGGLPPAGGLPPI